MKQQQSGEQSILQTCDSRSASPVTVTAYDRCVQGEQDFYIAFRVCGLGFPIGHLLALRTQNHLMDLHSKPTILTEQVKILCLQGLDPKHGHKGA